MQDFILLYNKLKEKYQSLAICIRGNVNIDSHNQSSGKLIFLNVRNIHIFFIENDGVVCKNTDNLALSYERLSKINSDNNFDLILGDY